MSIINENSRRYKYGSTMLIKESTRQRLDNQYTVKGDSYDSIINKVIDKAERFDKLLELPEFKKFCEKHKITFH